MIAINSKATTRAPGPRTRGLLLLLLGLMACSPALAQDRLHSLRADRRQAQRTLQTRLDKEAGAATFALLVIPVDFSDTRLPLDFDPGLELMPRLQPDSGSTLRNFYQVASAGRLDLQITLVPLVHLDGTRRDYSDIGYHGFSRSRLLATEAISTAAGMGLDFRGVDNDGPDRLAGTADDDGDIDGILVLHAGPGQENDLQTGLVQALQFFLDEPVVSNGIQASFYAVASLHSGLGIWAHETGHLLGLEDRYDPLLHPEPGGVDVRSLGGLGRFSLMASGAWGKGDGKSPALLDAYSLLSLGWATEHNFSRGGPSPLDLRPSLQSGQVTRIWTEGRRETEFFLLETRDPQLTVPFDGEIPGRQLLIYHVDETVIEGGWRDEGNGQYHLRVRLVEADHDFQLAQGLDDGGLSDLFPGTTGQTRFDNTTLPSSRGYDGPTQVQLSDITVTPAGVSLLAATATGPALEFSAEYTSGPAAELTLVVTETGTPLAFLRGEIRAIDGHVDGSWQGSPVAVFDLVRRPDGTWVPESPLTWVQDSLPGVGAATTFSYRFTSDQFDSGQILRQWSWSTPGDIFRISGTSDYGWTTEYPDGDTETTWHTWSTAPWLSADQAAVLSCTGADFQTSALWPAVHYQNRAWVRRVSPALGPEITAVRLVHAVEAEILHTGVAMDGARVAWRNPAGERVVVPPVDGWDLTLSPGTFNDLAGAPVLADSLLSWHADNLVWRTDVFPLPTGVGPWQMELTFASNTAWRYRGWTIAEMKGLATPPPVSAFPVGWHQVGGLDWTWPFAPQDATTEFVVQHFAPDPGTWDDLLTVPQTNEPDYHVPAASLTGKLPGGASARHLVRVVGVSAKGPVASRPLVVYADGGDGHGPVLGLPRPNPAAGAVQLMLKIPDGSPARLRVYDLRGRLVTSREYPPGSHLFRWEGLDATGRRVAAGTYFIRLEGSGPVNTRKVVLLN